MNDNKTIFDFYFWAAVPMGTKFCRMERFFVCLYVRLSSSSRAEELAGQALDLVSQNSEPARQVSEAGSQASELAS